MLTETEKQIINQIAVDSESGRHLLRTDDTWKKFPFSKEEYMEIAQFITENVDTVLKPADILNYNYDKRLYEILLSYCSYKDYGFFHILKNIVGDE